MCLHQVLHTQTFHTVSYVYFLYFCKLIQMMAILLSVSQQPTLEFHLHTHFFISHCNLKSWNCHRFKCFMDGCKDKERVIEVDKLFQGDAISVAQVHSFALFQFIALLWCNIIIVLKCNKWLIGLRWIFQFE